MNLVASRGVIGMWCPDSGATSHIMVNGKFLQNCYSTKGQNSSILARNGDSMEFIGSRKSFASINDNKVILHDMLLVSSTSRNLLSIHRLCLENGVMVEFDARR